MLVLIKGAPGTGKSTLADRLVRALGLAPVRWQAAPGLMDYAQHLMAGWIDLAAFFAASRHLDMERVATLLQVEHWNELPPPPRWREGADRGEMLAWRSRFLAQLDAGRFLPELFQLTRRLIDAAEHAVVEGRLLGTTLTDSQLTRMLRERYQGVPIQNPAPAADPRRRRRPARRPRQRQTLQPRPGPPGPAPRARTVAGTS